MQILPATGHASIVCSKYLSTCSVSSSPLLIVPIIVSLVAVHITVSVHITVAEDASG
jgi:hypothetical protein